MIMEDLKDLLIKSIYSDVKAKDYFFGNLCNETLFVDLISIVRNSDSDDARMEAAFYISQFDTKIITKSEAELLLLMDDELDSIAVHIMVALSRIKSPLALKKIINERIKPNMYWEACALENYFGEDIYGTENNKSSME